MLGRLIPLLRVIAIGVPVAGAIPTGVNLYHSFKHGIPYAQVSHRLEQYDFGCATWIGRSSTRK